MVRPIRQPAQNSSLVKPRGGCVYRQHDGAMTSALVVALQGDSVAWRPIEESVGDASVSRRLPPHLRGACVTCETFCPRSSSHRLLHDLVSPGLHLCSKGELPRYGWTSSTSAASTGCSGSASPLPTSVPGQPVRSGPFHSLTRSPLFLSGTPSLLGPAFPFLLGSSSLRPASAGLSSPDPSFFGMPPIRRPFGSPQSPPYQRRDMSRLVAVHACLCFEFSTVQ